jgi:flagellar basal-body rod protein FlgG
MTAQQLNVDVISNNLANANTTGFKRSRADFQDLLYQNIRLAGTSSSSENKIPTGIQVGMGCRPVAVARLFDQGDYQITGNSLDIAIEGDGFFQVIQPDGNTAYTRAGAFKMDSEGNIVTSDGYRLEPTITIPSDATAITVGSDGTVSVLQGDGSPSTTIGNITLATFPNPTGLQGVGRNLYMPTDSSGEATTGTPGIGGLGTLRQASLEMSNVDIVSEMVNLIVAQRAYEVNSKSIQTADAMLQLANNIKR